MTSVISAVRGFRRLRVLVVGDAMLDSYYLGTATRLSPEGPVPVVSSRARRHLPGGAANVAANARALGASVSLLAVVGADHEADVLRGALEQRQVDATHLIVDRGRPTTTKLRIVANDRFIARFDEESDDDLAGDVEESFILAFRGLFRESDVVIVSDYVKGVITPRLIAELSVLNRDQERLVVVDSKDLSRHRFSNISVITPNHLEAQKACKVQLPSHLSPMPDVALEGIGRSLLGEIGTRWVIMTVGSEGAVLFERDRPMLRVRAREVRSPDVVGAGDTLTAALALGLASGLDIASASHVAVEAAGIAVSKAFTAAVEQHELLQRLSVGDRPETPKMLAQRLEGYRARSKRIVLTNGSFDGLHSGHVAFLREARRLGDVLVVGVNSDVSIRRRTGQGPLLPEEERLSVVAALESVDHAVLFDEVTPSALIREVRPSIHVKGGDYEGEKLPELEAVQEVGGELIILPLREPTVGAVSNGRPDRHGRRVKVALTVVRGNSGSGASRPSDDDLEEAAG